MPKGFRPDLPAQRQREFAVVIFGAGQGRGRFYVPMWKSVVGKSPSPERRNGDILRELSGAEFLPNHDQPCNVCEVGH
jgi:hypothetical protein